MRHDRRDLARHAQCTLQVPGVCLGAKGRNTVVAAHSNWLKDGKGMGYKAQADDHRMTVFACHACHAWLDQGPAPKSVKQWYFDAALRYTDALVAAMLTGA